MARIVEIEEGDLLTPEEVVIFLRMAKPGDKKQMAKSLFTLRNWRSLRKGPRFRKNGREVLYYKKDLIEYLNNNEVRTSNAA